MHRPSLINRGVAAVGRLQTGASVAPRTRLPGWFVVTGPIPVKIHPRWQRLNELFFHAARLQGAERQAFIARETQGEPELEREVTRVARAR